jgi:hypothetical protein
MSDTPLSCDCGKVRGTLRDPSALRMVCHCLDCQTYAHHLDRADLLDAHGGSEVAQVSPASVAITEGWEHVRALSQSPKGAVRVYASCCNTPIANLSGDPRFPFVGLVTAFTEDGVSRDDALGPVIARVQGKDACGDASTLDAHDGNPPSVLARVVPRILWWRVTGAWKQSPFFDETHTLRVDREVMPRETRAALQERVRAS